jgi:hypothetical protein
MPSATGNPTRDRILYDAIQKLGDVPTFEATVNAVPRDFDLDEGEYNTAIKILHVAPRPARLLIDRNPDGHSLVAPEVAETKLPDDIRGTIAYEAPAERTHDAPIDPPLTHQQANDAVLAAENNLGNARLALRHAQETTKSARAANANAITIWQCGLPVYTSEMNVRDFLKSQQAARRERIAQGGPAATTPPGKSYLDRAAKYGRDNSAEGAARSRMQHGAHRGAFPTSQKFQQNHDPRRGAVAKLPSER